MQPTPGKLALKVKMGADPQHMRIQRQTGRSQRFRLGTQTDYWEVLGVPCQCFGFRVKRGFEPVGQESAK